MAPKNSSISVAIATYNEAKNLGQCLDAVVSWANQIVVVDGGSTDATLAIAKKYNADITVTTNPSIFHINKQKALNKCTSNWILQLDADEIVTESLKSEILSRIIAYDAKEGYYIPRKNYFLGHWLSKGGQYPDFVIRLFKKGKGSFPSKSVHEQIDIDGQVGYLKEALIHNTSRTTGDYWRKANAYTALTAQSWKEKKMKPSLSNFVMYMLIKPVFIFVSLFVRHKGFVDGYWGLLFAWFSALHYPLAYRKFLRLNVV